MLSRCVVASADDPAALATFRAPGPAGKRGPAQARGRGRGRARVVGLALAGVVATQLWHQVYVDESLADVPARTAPARASA